MPLVLVAGCGAETAPSTAELASPVPAVTDARAPLAKAWDALRAGRYRVEMTVDSSQYGVYSNDATIDVDADVTHVVTGFSGETNELMTFGDDVLLESTRMLRGAPGVPPGTKWIHLDGKRLEGYAPRAAAFAGLADGVGGGVSQPYWAGPREIKGRLDTGKVRLGALVSTSGDLTTVVHGPREDTVRIPFTATVDEQGRLATITWDLRQSNRPVEVSVTFAISEYGTARTPEPPAPSTVIEAPEESYQALADSIAERQE